MRALWHSKIQWRLWFFIFIFIFILGLGGFRSKWRIGGVWGGGGIFLPLVFELGLRDRDVPIISRIK